MYLYLNIILLSQLRPSKDIFTNDLDIAETFPNIVKLKKWNLFQENDAFIREIEQALLKSYICNDSKYIDIYGDKSELENIIEFISYRHEKEDARFRDLSSKTKEAVVEVVADESISSKD